MQCSPSLERTVRRWTTSEDGAADTLDVGPPIVRVLAPVEATSPRTVATAAAPEDGAGYAA